MVAVCGWTCTPSSNILCIVSGLHVVDGDGSSLLGRNWLEQLKLNWRNIFHVSKVDTLSDVLGRHKMFFDWEPSKVLWQI